MLRTGLLTRLDRVINDRLFHTVFQPIVDLEADRVVGWEALTRLDYGIPVLDCLEDADELGLRAEVELAFLEVALESARLIPDGAWVSVNVSPSVLVDRCDVIAALIARSDVPVVVEVTENEPIQNYQQIRQALSYLGPNTRLALDDIGSGYAYMAHIVRMQAEHIKLDRLWTSRLPADPTAMLVVTALMEICQQFGTDLIAEGVETPEELSSLKSLGVRYAQGYLLGRPAPLPYGDDTRSIHPRSPA